MPIKSTVELNCLVLCSEETAEIALRDAIGQHSCVQIQDIIRSEDKLKDALRASAVDLLIIAKADNSESLPACLLRYPDLQILLTLPGRKIGDLAHWSAQGVDEVVSLQRADRLSHSLSRVIEGCKMHIRLRRLTRLLSAQYKLQQILLNTYAEALALIQNGSIIESNDCFDSLINCQQEDNKARSIEWKRWVSAQSFRELLDSSLHGASETTISSNENRHYRARIESLILDGGPAQLIRINPSPIGLNSLPDLETDSVTGLLVRDSLTQRLQSLLQSSDTDTRYTALLITLPIPDNASHFSGVDRTLQDLLIYRAANSIGQYFTSDTLLGRTGINTLMMARPANGEHSRKLAVRIRDALGSLGGLIDDPSSVSIKTLTLATNTLSAIEVVERLEQPRRASAANKPILIDRQPLSA